MFTTYEGGTTGKRFVTYLREMLIPALKKGDIAVMDNLRSHHVNAVGGSFAPKWDYTTLSAAI